MAARRPAAKATKKRAAPKRRKKPQWETVAPPPMAPPGSVPQPGGQPINRSTWAVFAHLSAFGMVVAPFGNILGPLVVWLVKKEDAFVAEHGRESLNFQISMTIYGLMIAALLITFVASGVAGQPPLVDTSEFAPPSAVADTVTTLFLAYVLFDIVIVIAAAARASQGVAFRYPLRIRFVR